MIYDRVQNKAPTLTTPMQTDAVNEDEDQLYESFNEKIEVTKAELEDLLA